MGRRSLAELAARVPPFRGKTRLIRSSDRILRRMFDAPLRARLQGVEFALATEDAIDFGLLYLGGHQDSLVRYLSSRIGSSSSVFWDVGANVGSVSLPVAAACARCAVFSFEPSPTVMPRFATNLALNPSLTARVHPASIALSNADGYADFYTSNEAFNSGVGGLARAHNRTRQAVSVRTATGDALIAGREVPRPDIMKIDVEGFESEVFDGLTGLFTDGKPLELVFEHCLYRLRDRNQPSSHNVDRLRALGFYLFIQDATTEQVRPLRDSDLVRDCDIIARIG